MFGQVKNWSRPVFGTWKFVEDRFSKSDPEFIAKHIFEDKFSKSIQNLWQTLA